MDEVRPGQRAISADALNDAISGGRSALGTRVQGGTAKHLTGVGIAIDTAQQQRRKDFNDDVFRKVVIKKSPSTTNPGWVTVQRVQYMDWPIQPCTDTGCRIELAGVEFEARPDFGKTTGSYSEHEVVTTIDTSTTFYDCRWDGREWILNPPPVGGSTTDLCLVHGRAPGTPSWSTPADFLRIIHMKKNPNYGLVPPGSPPGTQPDTNTHIWGGLSADPLGYSLVSCWPGTKQADWEPYLSTNSGFPPVIATNPVYLTTKMIGGVEYICPEVFVETGAPDSGTLAGDC